MGVSSAKTSALSGDAPAAAAIAVLTILAALAVALDWIVPFTPIGRDLCHLLMSTTAIGAVLTYACHRTPRLRPLAPQVLLATFFLVPLGSTFVLGGLVSPTLAFLVIGPMLATQLAGRRTAIFWSAVVGVAVAGMIWADRSGVELPSIMRDANRPVVNGIVQYLVVIAVVCVAIRNASVSARLRTDLAAERARYAELASTDALTGAANRRRFEQHLEMAVERARRNESGVGVVLFDLDDFKPVNDEHGHAAGDAVLCEFAARLQSITRRTDLVARLGGDEFAVVIEGLRSREDLEALARKLEERACQPVGYRGASIACKASYGSALFPKDTKERARLLEIADGQMPAARSRSERPVPRQPVYGSERSGAARRARSPRERRDWRSSIKV